MAEQLILPESGDKAEIYRTILPQIEAVIEPEPNLIANLANVCAILREAFGHFWIGFYLREGDELVLGPFQGPLACTRIPVDPKPRGVCGDSAHSRKTILVPDVEKYPGHIACSSLSRSEIVVPLVAGDTCRMVLDVDSADLDAFDDTDREGLEAVVAAIRRKHFAEL